MTNQEIIIINLKNKITEGGYSVIIRDEEKILKLFVKHKDKNRPFEDTLRKLVFESEKKAYEIIQTIPELLPYVPKYYGSNIISQVIDENDKDVSDLYLLDCCYTIEYINWKFYKIGLFKEENNVKQVLDLFEKNGIKYYEDSSIAYINDKNNFRIIDFATEDAYHENEFKYL